MSSKKHMDYDDLLLLYKYISLNYSAKKITQLLKKDRSTIYRIIICNSRIENERTYSIRFKNCEHLLKCKKDGILNKNYTCDVFTSSNLLILDNEIYLNDLLYLIFQLTIFFFRFLTSFRKSTKND